ncbi:glutamyl-tRNA reductase [Serpentinicella sp. ANB-PHB4]|uniref:glutamyl-tRNA reductase n=1 Tax=Serpentinicella sp. ANB-PHB4 TaxID=3074076 RepID=UPI00285815E8|nr:glutamyl-tRNA reductase [Serpentinicella sp. ANB-PHB4]MDR5659663.1 glutamyl-tRNA reductase [Serpentinicella sp. ANB-PHB4]
MEIITFGINHQNSSIELREKVAFTSTKKSAAYRLLKEDTFVKEGVILATCNRSEITAVVEDITVAEQWFKDFYNKFFNLQKDELEGYYAFNKGEDAIRHLFHVCCGLNSLVIGEDQILGQVKEAYHDALEERATGKILNRLFLDAVTLAKEVKAETRISENPLSISSIAVKQIERILLELNNKKVLIIGFGKMSRIAVENLIDKGVEQIYICNRSEDKVQDILNDKIVFLPYNQKYRVINEVDAVISATGAPHFILEKTEFDSTYTQNKPICLVDIALPRDIDPAIGEVGEISLFHIDDLKEIARDNLAYRLNCIDRIKECIEAGVEKYEMWYQCLPIYPRIEAIKDYSESLTDQELKRLFNKLAHMEEKDRQTIELVVKSLVKKMWKKPILQLKDAGNQGKGEEFASFVDAFLGLDASCSK